MGTTNVSFLLMLLSVLLQNGCEAVFLHETSYIEIKPGVAEKDFGFSIAYQVNSLSKWGSLLVGAPHSDDSMGHVYRCPIENILKGQNKCDLVPIDLKSVPNMLTGHLNPKQSYCLGASIVATPDYFIACAPLVPKEVSSRNVKVKQATGSCFIYNGTQAVPLRGTPEQQEFLMARGRSFPSIGPLLGGTGWTAIADGTNKQILISKPTVVEDDVVYVEMENPYKFASSFVLNSNLKDYKSKMFSLQDRINLGYGIAAGNFFSKDVLYAVSMQNMQRQGMIAFLTANRTIIKKPVRFDNEEEDLLIKGSSGTQFGATLEAIDVNGDGISDLLVGAPSQCPDDEGYDVGALFIYLGGDMLSINSAEKTRVILASKIGSYFGSAVAATDIDGDSFPEIFVSAPYEDFGQGAVYVFSGYEINRVLFSEQSIEEVSLSDLKFSQRMQVRETKTFGYSLKILPDVDENGCNELIVGAIGSSNVFLFRCLPAVTVTLFLRLDNPVLKDSDKSVILEVCVNVTYHSKSEVSGYFEVRNKLDDLRALISDTIFKVDLSSRKESHCKNIIVEFGTIEPGTYMFSSVLNTTRLNHEGEKIFDTKWVTLSSYSKTETSIQIRRQCAEPKLQMFVLWNERESVQINYELGTSETENVTVLVKSEQDSGCQMCVRIRIVGVHVASIPCGVDGEDYRCFLPKPMAKDTEHPIHIVLDMSKFTNMDKKFNIDVRLFYDCKSNSSNLQNGLTADFYFKGKPIGIIGMSQNLTKTDSEIFKLQEGAPPFNVTHKYIIVNKNSIKWLNTSIMIRVENQDSKVYKYQIPYVENLEKGLKFESGESDNFRFFNCTVDLMARSSLAIVLTIWIYAQNIPHYYTKNGIRLRSDIIVRYYQPSSAGDINNSPPTVGSLQKGLKTFIFYEKEMSLKHKKNVIIIIATILAITIFLAVAFVLYKLGFFERTSKKRLESFKASIRSRNMSFRAETSGHNDCPGDNDQQIIESDCEIIDSVFELNEPQLTFDGSNVSLTCSDNTLLIPEDKKLVKL